VEQQGERKLRKFSSSIFQPICMFFLHCLVISLTQFLVKFVVFFFVDPWDPLLRGLITSSHIQYCFTS
jgi:hypothetical protein